MGLQVRALVFDVLGTVVDWRSAIIREGRALGPELDWPSLADRWRGLYRPTIDQVTRVSGPGLPSTRSSGRCSSRCSPGSPATT